MDPSKTIVLINGANQGIGYETIKKLATENPSYHIITGCRSLQEGNAAAATLPNLSVEPIVLHIKSDASISDTFTTVQERYSRVDILINNAGISQRALPEGLSLRGQYTRTIDTNAISAAYMTDACIPLLHWSSHARSIFTTSELGSIADTLKPLISCMTGSTPHRTKRPRRLREW